jgi:tRNA pseudouridine55 synthase
MKGGAARPRVEWRDVDGILLIDKQVGLSSNQALQRARHLYRARKAGHTGSLDPLASGVLPLCFGQATKFAGHLLESDKTYRATLALGHRTLTGDREGEVVERRAVPALDAADVERVLERFRGGIDQVPPMYSALKHDGEPLYALARRGESVERPSRRVTIRNLVLVALAPASLELEISCSKGTYVRTLGEDIARSLGTCGHLAALRRTAVGGFAGSSTATLAELAALDGRLAELDARLLPVDAALGELPRTALDASATMCLRHGQTVPYAKEPPGTRIRAYDAVGGFIGLTVVAADGAALVPLRLMIGDGFRDL